MLRVLAQARHGGVGHAHSEVTVEGQVGKGLRAARQPLLVVLVHLRTGFVGLSRRVVRVSGDGRLASAQRT